MRDFFSDPATPEDGSLFDAAQTQQGLQVPEEDSSLLDLDDILLSPFRAAEGLVRGVVGLVDIIPGVDTQISSGTRLFGEADTAVGGLLTGAMEFAMGFFPVAGQLGKLGKVKALGRTVDFAGKGLKASAIRGAAAGAVVDFAAWDGNEARLSNLVQAYPALANPVSDFLAADEDDAEFVGRLKNAVEGLGIGMIFEGLAAGLRGMRAGRKHINTTGSKDGVEEVAQKAAQESEEGLGFFSDKEGQADINFPANDPFEASQASVSVSSVTEFGGGEFNTGGGAAVDLVAEAEEIFPNPRRKRGADNFFRRLELEANLVGTRDARDDVEAVREFMKDVGVQHFDDLGISIHKNLDSEGRFEFATDIIRLNKRVAAEGTLKDTAVHELWHKLSTHLPEKDVAAVRASYQKALGKQPLVKKVIGLTAEDGSLDANTVDGLIKEFGEDAVKDVIGKTNDGSFAVSLTRELYRFQDEDEWFAEVLGEISQGRADYLDQAAPSGSVKRLFQDLGVIVRDMYVYAKEKLGFGGPEKRIFNDFLKGKNLKKVRSETLEFGGRTTADLPKPNGAGSGKPPLSRTPKGLNALNKDLLGTSDAELDTIATRLTELNGLPTHEIIEEMKDFSGYNFGPQIEEHGQAVVLGAVQDILLSRKRLSGTTLAEATEAVQGMLEEVSTISGTDPQQMASILVKRGKQSIKDLKEAEAILGANTVVMRQLGKEVYEATTGALKGKVDQRIIDAKLSAIVELTESINGIKTAQGSGLNTNNFTLDPAAKATSDVAEFLKDATPKQKKQGLRLLNGLAEGADPTSVGQMVRFIKQSRGSRMNERLLHLWMNSILSGGRTSAINVATPAMLKAYTMAGDLVGGMAQYTRSGGADATILRQLYGESVGMTKFFADSMKVGWKSFRMGNQSFSPKNSAAFVEGGSRAAKPFSAESFGLDPGSPIAGMADAFDTLVGIPMRALGGADSAMKDFLGRSQAHGELYAEGMRRELNTADMAKFMDDGMDRLFHEGQILSDDQLKVRGLQNAKNAGLTDPFAVEREAQKFVRDQRNLPEHEFHQGVSDRLKENVENTTFTNDLREGSISARTQAFVQQNPGLKWVAPFFKTPVNLISTAVDNMPLITIPKAVKLMAEAKFTGADAQGWRALEGSRSRILRQLGSADDNVKFKAMGRMSMGIGFTSWGINLAQSGMLTGNGPEDPELRGAMQQAGWLPYAVRTEVNGVATFVQYGRLDPLSTVLGSIADFGESLMHSEEENQGDIEAITAAISSVIANQLTEKSYLQGLSNLVSVLDDPHGAGAKQVNSMFSAIIPNFVAQGAQSTDPELRELDGFIDSVRARIPGLKALGIEGRTALAPKRNILGEQIKRPKSFGEDSIGSWVNSMSPIMYREVSDDVVFEELTALKHGFTPPKRTIMGLDLRSYRHKGGQDAYDRWQQLSGKVTIGGRTLRQSLKALIKTPDYQRLDPTSTIEFSSPRVRQIRSVLTQYRAQAFEKIRSEIPELSQDYSDARNRQHQAKASGNFQALLGVEQGLPTYLDQLQGNRVKPSLF